MASRLPIVLSLLVFAFASCGSHAAGKADQSSPKALAESIFAAARSGNFESLAGIAAADADGDTKEIAALAKADAEKQKSFRDFFAKGTVSGEPKVEGDKAEVPVLVGPDGKMADTFKMTKANGVWSLQGF